MPFGIGGGAFGIRGGISTRGVGVGAGPFSAGASWRGGGSGGAGLIAWLIGGAVLFLIAFWPFLLGTYVAVQSGAWNPSTERFVVGWIFETIYIAGLVGWFVLIRSKNAHTAAEQAQHLTDVIASGDVYAADHGRSVVYRHGTCTVNHRSADTAASCTKSSIPVTNQSRSIASASTTSTTWTPDYRSAARWPGAILAAGLVVGLVVLIADPIHSAAQQASVKPCPALAAAPGGGEVTMPDLIGQNGGQAETTLTGVGLASVHFTSTNPEGKSVIIPSNWTVVSSDPAPGCSVARDRSIEVFVTK